MKNIILNINIDLKTKSILRGKILGLINVLSKKGNNSNCLFIELEKSFNVDGEQIQQLILEVRHTPYSINDILNGKEISVNIFYPTSKINLLTKEKIYFDSLNHYATGEVKVDDKSKKN
jgi:hypothetical protein